MSKFLRYQWCKPPQRDNKNASYLLQVQCLHIANTYLTSASEKNDKDLLKITSMGVLDFFSQSFELHTVRYCICIQ